MVKLWKNSTKKSFDISKIEAYLWREFRNHYFNSLKILYYAWNEYAQKSQDSIHKDYKNEDITKEQYLHYTTSSLYLVVKYKESTHRYLFDTFEILVKREEEKEVKKFIKKYLGNNLPLASSKEKKKVNKTKEIIMKIAFGIKIRLHNPKELLKLILKYC